MNEISECVNGWFMVRIILCLFLIYFPLLGTNVYPGTPPYKVVSSILPWGDLLRGLCQGRCEVEVLIPPGSTPHTWSPRPTAIKMLHSARLFVYTDDCLEPWARDFWESQGKTGNNAPVVLRVSDLLHLKGCNKDPHLWLDFGFDKRVVTALGDLLTRIDPEGASFYERKKKELLARLDRLDHSYQEFLAHCAYKTIVIAGHNAFKRLGDRYGLKCLSVMGISPDAHVTPRGITRVIEFLKHNQARAVFFDHAVTDKIAQAIASETGAQVLELSPGVALTKEDLGKHMDFFKIMERNLRSLTTGLACDGGAP